MSPEELVELKLSNVIETYLGKPITPELLVQMQKVCSDIIAEHSDTLEGSVKIFSPWDNLSWWEKARHTVLGKAYDVKSRINVEIEINKKT